MAEARQTEKSSTETGFIETPSRRAVGLDYDSVDLQGSEIVQGLLDNLQRKVKEIQQALAGDDPYACDLQKISLLIKELLATDRAFWDTVEQALARNETHPLWPYIHKQETGDFLNFLVKELEEKIVRFTQIKQKHEGIKKRISEAEKSAAEQRRAAETAVAALKQKAKKTIKTLEGFLGLGLLPAARRQNAERLKQTRALLRHLDAIEEEIATPYFQRTDLSPNDLTAVKKIQDDLKQSAGGVRQAESDAYALSQEEKSIEFLWNGLQDSLEKILTELKLTGGGRKSREEFLSKVETATREMEQFENRVLEVFFRPLDITTEDEERGLAESLPETASPAVERARERSFRNAREMIRNFVAYYTKQDRTMEQIITDLAPHLERVRQSAFISFNDKGEEFVAVLESGRILPKDLLPPEKRRTAHTDPDAWKRRRQNELNLGFTEKEYPIYMALGSSLDTQRGAAPAFGAFHLSFSLESFRHKISCTLGDSLNNEGVPHSLRRPRYHEPEGAALRQLTLEHAIIIKALFDLDLRYEPKEGMLTNFFQPLSFIEVQISGPIDISEAQEIVISPADTLGEVARLQQTFGDVTNMVTKLSDAVAQGSEKRIPIKISSTRPSDDLSSYYNGKLYEQFYRQRQTTEVAA